MAVSVEQKVLRRGFGMGQRQSEAIVKAICYFLLILGGLTMIVPFIWMIATSFKPASEIYMGNFFPKAATFDNYREVVLKSLFPRWYLNSFICATLSTLSVVFFDSLAGYTLAKYDFPGKNVLFVLILSTLMVPTEMLIIPWYVMAVERGWVDTYWGIAFPGVITAGGVFLMRQFMKGVPDELIDAARIDGLNWRSKFCGKFYWSHVGISRGWSPGRARGGWGRGYGGWCFGGGRVRDSWFRRRGCGCRGGGCYPRLF